MSDRQDLAEIGGGLCAAGLGLAAFGTSIAPFVVPIAMLSGWLADFRDRCDKRLAQKAVDAALKALNDAPGLSASDISAARHYLASRTKGQLRLDPAAMARAARNGDLADVLFNLVSDDTMPKDGAVGPILRMVLDATYQTCRHDEAYHRILTQDILIDLCRSHGIAVDTLARIEAKVDLLVDQLSRTTEDLGLKKGMVIGIARVFATDVDDFDTALRELTRAVGIAARIERQGSMPLNTGDQISAVMAEVARLNRAQDFTAAAQVIDAAFDQLEAQRARLIEAGLEQAILRRNAEGAAKWAIHQVKLEAQDAALFDALRTEQDRWYVTGRDTGLAFDLQVSIALAQASQDQAATPDQRGAALNDLGNSLWTLGQREPGTAPLEEAVIAYRSALEERTRDRVPLDWARSWGNMGVVMGVLADRRSDMWLAPQAMKQIVEAETQMRAGGHVPDADYFATQIPRVQAVFNRLS